MSIGEEAEDWAQLWGTRAGFTVNPVRRDRGGWDHIFEMSLPRVPPASDSFGLPACSFTCRIQVKAIANGKRASQIKLSNWKRAAEDPLPWFFLLIRLQDGKVCEANLVHLDKTWVERVVAKLCALSSKEAASLHRRTLTINWSHGKALEDPVEAALAREIADAVGRDAFAYAAAKRDWYENAGYRGKRALYLHMHFGPHETRAFCKRLARAAVGLDSIETSNVQVSTKRFGKRVPLQPRGPLTAKMNWGKQSAHELKLDLIGEDGLHVATLPVSVRSSSSVFNLPREFWLLRFQSLMIDMLLDVGANTCTAQFTALDVDKPISLEVLHDNLAFLKCLDDREGKLLELSLSRNEFSASLARVTPPATLGRKQYSLAMDTVALWSLLGQLGAIDSDIELSANQITKLGPAARLMLRARGNTDSHFCLDMAVTADEVNFKKPVTVVTNPRIRIGAITFIDVIALTSIPTSLPDRNGELWVRLQPEQFRLLLARRYVGKTFEKFDLRQIESSIGSELERHGLGHAIGVDWSSIADEP